MRLAKGMLFVFVSATHMQFVETTSDPTPPQLTIFLYASSLSHSKHLHDRASDGPRHGSQSVKPGFIFCEKSFAPKAGVALSGAHVR